VFKLRLGKALNYRFNEDSQTSVFQWRDPSEGGPALDIERALHKLEQVACRRARLRRKPLILIINNIHLFQNDNNGGILTVVFISDDIWPCHVLRKNAWHMHVISVQDLDYHGAKDVSENIRKKTRRPATDYETLKEAILLVGGRLSHLNRISGSKDMVEVAKKLLDMELGWLRSQVGLIQNFDDEVMHKQKWSSCSWLLLREFVKRRQNQIAEITESGGSEEELPLPSIPWHECHQIMTRDDFLEELDRLNIISIDEE